jgi:alkylation response protein AidB-like acyl-CoA dehydrogenase
MTFEFTPDQQQLLARVRDAVRRTVAPAAEEIDRTGQIPPDVLGEIAEVIEALPGAVYRHRTGGAVLAAAVAVELAVGSAGVAAQVGLGALGSSPPDRPGLRGAGAPPAASDEHRLMIAAVAIGIGRAAVAEAVTAIRDTGVKPGEDPQTPHWAVADAHTGIEGAWLLVLKAAQAMDRAIASAREVATARMMAAHAAEDAVLASLRVVGPPGYRRGALLERLTRDARTVLLTLGTPESDRAIAAADLPA